MSHKQSGFPLLPGALGQNWVLVLAYQQPHPSEPQLPSWASWVSPGRHRPHVSAPFSWLSSPLYSPFLDASGLWVWNPCSKTESATLLEVKQLEALQISGLEVSPGFESRLCVHSAANEVEQVISPFCQWACSYFVVKTLFTSEKRYYNNFFWDLFRGLNVYRLTLFSIVPFSTVEL